MKEAKILSITGGTGHLGHCLIKMLLQQGFTIKALYNSNLPVFNHPKLTWLKGDITVPNTFKDFLENSNTLIHSAALISIGDKNENEVYLTNVIGTENLIKACTNRHVKMIYISSSAAVVETKGNEVFNENRPYKKQQGFAYDYSKATAEQKILDAVRSKNMKAFIIRPTAIIGPPDFRPSQFGQTILDMADYKMPIITKGGYNLVDVRDVSQTIINSIDLGRSGEIYLISGTYLKVKQIAKIANPNKFFATLSINFLIALLPLINCYKKMFGLPWPITKGSLITLKLAPKNMDNTKAIKELKHSSRPISETINELIIWFRKEK
jgi:dihydroflavonol-4-reductase